MSVQDRSVKMGVFDKFLDIMKLNDDDYDDDEFYEDDDFYDEDDYDQKPRRHSLFGKKNTKEENFDDFDMEEEKPEFRRFRYGRGEAGSTYISEQQSDSDETSGCKKRRKHGSLCCETVFC